MDNHTERLADGVWRVEVGFYVNAYLLANNGADDTAGLTLVDTGRAKHGPRLVRSIRLLGFDPRAVGDVLLTHWHSDHAGAAARFAQSSAEPRVWAGNDDLDVVRGDRRPGRGDALPGRMATFGVDPPPAPVPTVQALDDRQRFDIAGGTTVVATPGHTPGHCAFWLPQHGVLLAGDALWNVLRFSPMPRVSDADPSAPPTAIQRFLDCEPAVIGVGHGPPVTSGAVGKLQRLIAG